ncbi:hypothetical protein SO802_012994 [Lithocarpus litseifolius]|uniref:Uncharacterized protein n=1 Tax=Lithocarpus litseifolius TaxID=425828 RepID=A0AAW2D4C0_9ROSI
MPRKRFWHFGVRNVSFNAPGGALCPTSYGEMKILWLDVGNDIRVGDPWLARIDILVPEFLDREGIVPIELPFHCSPREEAVPKEETTSSPLSLEAEIDQFQLEKERKEQGEPVIQVSVLEEELDRFSGICAFEFIVVHVARGLEEEEKMLLERKKGLHELLAGKAKGSAPKDALGSQLLPTLPPPPPLANLFASANLKKRKKDKEVVEEGELVPYNERVPPKLPKTF